MRPWRWCCCGHCAAWLCCVAALGRPVAGARVTWTATAGMATATIAGGKARAVAHREVRLAVRRVGHRLRRLRLRRWCLLPLFLSTARARGASGLRALSIVVAERKLASFLSRALRLVAERTVSLWTAVLKRRAAESARVGFVLSECNRHLHAHHSFVFCLNLTRRPRAIQRPSLVL